MTSKISFEADGVVLPITDAESGQVAEWLGRVAAAHDRVCGRITYRFCSDDAILVANRQFVAHDYYTDIITFDYSSGNVVSGDVLISVDTVRSNAGLLGVPFRRELMRVVAHGLLHLCGINDKLPGEREVMEAHEDAALLLLES